MTRRPMLAIAALFLMPTVSLAARPTAKQVEFFEKKIRPILVSRCYKCHSKDSKKVKGGLLLDTRAGWMRGGESGPAISPGDPKDSLLIQAINFDGLEMPPGGKLPASEIALLTSWVKMGAPDPRVSKLDAPILRKINIVEGKKYWAFQPPRTTAAPSVRNTAWPQSDIDRYVLALLEAKKIQPARDASPRALIRRVHFDLIGLPPTPKVVKQFVADPSPQAFAKIVDNLLKSPQFGERWGRHWFDVARYAESTGKERNFTFPHAWRYRDYVIRSFNQDKPYDQFIREQVAGDLLPAKTLARRNDLIVATGFLALGPKSLNERNRQRFHMDVVDEQVDVTSRAILGITVSCARCHDHKFDPIPTKDYYALAGIFSSTKTFYGIQRGAGNRQPSTLIALQQPGGKTKAKAKAKTAVAKAKPAAKAAANVKAQRRRLNALRKKLRTAQQKRRRLAGTAAPQARKAKKGKNKVGKKKRKGKKNRKRRQQKSNQNQPAAKGANKAEIAALDREIAKLRRQFRQLNRRINGKNKRRRGRAAIPKGPVAMGVAEGRVADVAVHIRGEVTRKGEVVKRGFLQVVDFDSVPQVNRKQSGRLELADYLVHPDNPLTARVMVNRVWMHLFGQGIVRTTDNFGATGERPGNQPLLDHLAVQLVRHNWSTKKLIRYIVLSRTYQLSSQFDKKNFDKDPENRLNWRANHRRLDAEAIRDAVLASSGQLDLTPRKRSVIAELSGASTNIGRNQQTVRRLNASSNHRSVYLPIVRNLVPGMLRAFDFAEPSMLVGRRDVTTVPRQALFMMNNPFILQQSQRMAQRLIKQEPNIDGQISLAFELAYGRSPKPAEMVSSKNFVKDFRKELNNGDSKGARTAGLAQLCQALFASAEFQCLE